MNNDSKFNEAWEEYQRGMTKEEIIRLRDAGFDVKTVMQYPLTPPKCYQPHEVHLNLKRRIIEGTGPQVEHVKWTIVEWKSNGRSMTRKYQELYKRQNGK